MGFGFWSFNRQKIFRAFCDVKPTIYRQRTSRALMVAALETK
jgi:hypothetical protein